MPARRGNTPVTLRWTTSLQLPNCKNMTRRSRFSRSRFGKQSRVDIAAASTNMMHPVSRVDRVNDMLNGSNARMPSDIKNSYSKTCTCNCFSDHYYTNKKLHYCEEHSTSDVLSWCTLWHFSGDNLLMANQPLYVIGHESYRILRNNAK